MRYSLTMAFFAILIITACQPAAEKQYLTEGPEVDLGKKFMEAYLAGNWDAIPSMYSDTAKVFRNTNFMTAEGFTPSQYAEDLQNGLQGISSYSFDPQIWECIINENGQHWVHFWGIWKGHHDGTNKDYEIAVHAAMLVEAGKIQAQADFFNNVEITLDVMALQQKQAAAEAEEDAGD